MLKSKLLALTVEELANTVTHGLGLLLSLIGFVVLISLAFLKGDSLSITGCVIYGLSLIILYAASTIYHSTTSPKMKRRMQVADHCGIYLLIAGSYTPFGLIILNGTVGRNLLIAIWALAILGIFVKLLVKNRYPAINVVSYLLMGWIGIFAVQPLLEAIGMSAIILVVGGGVAYSLGVIFFGWHRIPHNHAIFHVFILTGSILHYIAVVLYVVPYSLRY